MWVNGGITPRISKLQLRRGGGANGQLHGLCPVSIQSKDSPKWYSFCVSLYSWAYVAQYQLPLKGKMLKNIPIKTNIRLLGLESWKIILNRRKASELGRLTVILCPVKTAQYC
jgi:hypothetical protein